ncbi:MAG TPA: ATP-binding protein [Microthrixaceae bacterium]|nr:ATP-binding protein [Microthrixaceae bacterium]
MASTPRTHADPQTRSLLVGVSVVRWATILWAGVVLTVDASDDQIDHPAIAAAILLVVAAWSIVTTYLTTADPDGMGSWLVIGVDLTAAAALVIGNVVVYAGAPEQSFGSAWPLTAVIFTGVSRGRTAGLVAGVSLGVLNVVVSGSVDPGTGSTWVGAAGTSVLLGLGGWASGFVTDRLRKAELEVAEARIREQFARTLHDGVLQTLAAVQRRSDDPGLVEIARNQELELRRYVTGDFAAPADDLMSSMRDAARLVERRDGVVCEVVAVEVPDLEAAAVAALTAAATEAATNAAKHAGATRITWCLDRHPEGGAVCSVRDDGSGFEPVATEEGVGWTRSIRGRLAEVGGRAEVSSTPGSGTEVRLWVP